MSSFRIMDTKFRILKGGKIGLAMSIAMIGGMLTLGSTSANATSYFTDISASGGWSTLVDQTGHGSDNYLQATSYSNNGSYTDYVETTNFDNVLIAPTSFVTDNYTASLNATSWTGDWLELYNASTTSDSSMSPLTLIFNTGTNANNITKDNVQVYDAAEVSGTYGWTTTTVSLSHSTYGGDYTANLIFQGTNVVSGYTDIDAGNIRLNGGATFAGTVQAGSADVYTSSQITFNDHVDLTPGTTDALTFYNGGNVVLNNGLTGNVDFNGQNATVTLSNGDIDGHIDTSTNGSGTLKFTTSVTSFVSGNVGTTANLKEIIMEGTGYVDVNGSVDTNLVTFNSAGTLQVNDLDTTRTDTTLGTVNFKEFNGTLKVDGGDLIGNIVTDLDDNGIITMMGGIYDSENIEASTQSITQSITGQIGTSSKKIKTLNIGDGVSNYYSVTTANGDIYATSTVLNNDELNGGNGIHGSELSMASEYDLYSTVTTANHHLGTLKLLGGNQIVTGNVGTTDTRLAQVDSGANGAISNFGSDVYADTVSNTGTGTTNFSNDVGADIINVSNGISNFTNNVTAGTTNIGTGTGNFNTNGVGATESDIAFTGTGIANLHTGLTGDINFAGNNASVNVWENQSIVGNVTTTINNTGIVNFKAGQYNTLDGQVGSETYGISALNINTDNTPLSAEVTVTGDVYANNINLNDGTLRVAVNQHLIDTEVARTTFITTTGANPEGSGFLLLMGGDQLIDGQVGTSDHQISAVYTNSSVAGTTTFNEKVYIGQLRNGGYWEDVAKTGHAIFNEMAFINNLEAGTLTGGVIDLNGINADNTHASGMIGQLFLNNTSTTVNIGDNVNLTVIDLGDENAPDGVAFTYANNATMHFVGDSTVIGQVGGGNDYDNSTFAEIYAGANGKTVTFKNDVHVLEGALNPATFYVSGTGTVNFEGNLYGDLVYNADGVVNVSNGKSILVNTVPVAVTTIHDGTGTLNYLGSTTLDTDIGTPLKGLAEVNFNTATNNVVQEIGYNVYALNTTIGHTPSTNDSSTNLVDVTGQYDYAGATTIKEFRGQTAANITNDITFGGNLSIADEKSAINFGKSHVTVSDNFRTNDGSMSFTVNTRDITGINQASSTNSGSAHVTTDTLTMSGEEKIHINYVGSLANNGKYELITSSNNGGVTYTEVEGDGDGRLTDNSFVIDSKVSQDTEGCLILTADRTSSGNYSADELYVQKSDTKNHFSNSAAIALAGISADGSQTGDMVEVIQKLELDSYGYGNSKENLAVQVQKLAPIVNTSFAQTSIGATKLVTDTVGSRLSDVRGLSSGEEVKDRGAWAKVIGSTASQDKVGQFDGYSLSSGGVVFGIDKELRNNAIIGLAAGYTNTKTDQDDFRDGDKSTTDSYQLSLYGSKTFDKAYVDGSLSYTKHNTDGTRSTAIDRVASYDVDANQLSAKVNGGYNFAFENKVTLTPFASLEYSNIKQDSYKEEGAGAISLSVDDVTVNRGGAGLGVKVSKEIKTENKVVYVPEFKLGANKYFGDDNVEVAAQFEQGNKFITKGAEMTDLMYNAGLGLKTKFTEATSVSLTTDYERSNDGDFQGVNGQLTFRMQF